MTASFALSVPDDPQLVARLTAAVEQQSDPPISVGRSRTAVLAFEAETGEMMLRKPCDPGAGGSGRAGLAIDGSATELMCQIGVHEFVTPAAP